MSFTSLTLLMMTRKEGGEILVGVWPICNESSQEVAISNCIMTAVSFRMRAVFCSQIWTLANSRIIVNILFAILKAASFVMRLVTEPYYQFLAFLIQSTNLFFLKVLMYI